MSRENSFIRQNRVSRNFKREIDLCRKFKMIKIIPLLENTAQSKEYRRKHGLSLYIETPKHKILFDSGPNDLFIKNAEKLGVSIPDVDLLIISHGHVDHCGGLSAFLKHNSKAKIYLRPQAVDKHYVKVLGIPFYAGINARLVKGDRFRFTDELTVIDDEITLFSNVRAKCPLPSSDDNLLVKKNGRIINDDFIHEQNMIISSEGKHAVFCGCAHAGIANITDKARQIIGKNPDDVVGGFHLFEPTKRKYEPDDYIAMVCAELQKFNARFYTCHCTGIKAYETMKKNGLILSYLHTGTVCKLYE